MAQTKKPKPANKAGASTSARSTISGPSKRDLRRSSDALAAKMEAADALAEAMPANTNKPSE